MPADPTSSVSADLRTAAPLALAWMDATELGPAAALDDLWSRPHDR
jgi:hypothetical protein